MGKHQEGLVVCQCEEWYRLSLEEVTLSFGVTSKVILEILDEGIISAQKNEQRELYFDNEALRRIRTILQLNRDLGVNLPGAALVLDLLAEIEHLKVLSHHKL